MNLHCAHKPFRKSNQSKIQSFVQKKNQLASPSRLALPARRFISKNPELGHHVAKGEFE